MEKAFHKAAQADFFIPDLCATRPVFLMVLLSQLLVIVRVLLASNLPDFNWELLGLSSLLVQWVVLVSAALICTGRSLLARMPLVAAVAAVFIVVGVVTLLSSIAAVSIVPPSLGGNSLGGWVARNVCIAVVATGIALRYFYLQHALSIREKAALRAQLDALQARIRPHFLFNTMNSIASLVATRPDDAEQVIEDLSDLFRASLSEHRTFSTVGEEWHLCEQYLGIEKWRLGERLRLEAEVDKDVLDAPMPHLLLQPLVENAVYHGVAPLPEGGCIEVKIARQADDVIVEVRNPVGEAQVNDGHHIALDNIRQRLVTLYGQEGSLTTAAGQSHFSACLRVPLAADSSTITPG